MKRFVWGLAAVLCLGAGCAVMAVGAAWEYADPENSGIDAARLEQMRQIIDGLDLPIDSVVVVRHGKIVFEHFPSTYGPSQLHNLYSVTKSVTSLLIGIAIEQGVIGGVDERVIDFFPDREIANLDERKASMTLKHLLTMTSGLKWQGPDDMFHSWGAGIASGDPVQYALDRPMAYPPGEVWYYNGACSHLLSAILTQASGMSTLSYARRYLFDPLGITSVRWPRDPHGIYYGGQDIWLSPYDMAKLGQLMLNGGVWNGVQIVPARWIEASTQPIDIPWSGGYGYQWWLYPESGISYASGAFEQRIYVIPDYDLVVVFTASNWPSGIAVGERNEGPPVVDWLLGSFILPSCDAYARREYAGFGFSLQVPQLAQGYAQGWGEATASQTSGLVSFAFAGSPYQRAGMQWAPSEAVGDTASALAGFISVLEQSVDRIDAMGPTVETVIGERSVLVQVLSIVAEEGPLTAGVAAFDCVDVGRTFVVYHAMRAELAQWMDVHDELHALLTTFVCSD